MIFVEVLVRSVETFKVKDCAMNKTVSRLV